MNKIRLAIVRHSDPAAMDRPLIKKLVEHEERMDNNPIIQARRVASLREMRRAFLPWIVFGIVLQGIGWAALQRYLPGLISVNFAAIGAALNATLLIGAFKSILKIDE